MHRTIRARVAAIALMTALLCVRSVAPGGAESPVRLKDVVTLHGPSSMPLIGYGLIVGLNKTGDRRQTLFSAQTLANMLERFGVTTPASQIKIENVAAVLVTAELPPFVRAGAHVDVTASSVGDARSLQGGVLLATALRGPDGGVRAMAQGPLTLGGFGGSAGATSVSVNHLTVGRVPAGALVQVDGGRGVPESDTIQLALREPDFVSAAYVMKAVNGTLGEGVAHVVDPGTVDVKVPEAYRGAVADLMALLDQLPVETDVIARVVINERTGTVVVGGRVQLGPAAVAHGSLSVRISTKYDVSQPGPFSKGETAVVPNQDVEVKETTARLVALEEGTSLEHVTRALNALGASPRDIIAIVQALKAAGALHAEIVIL